MLGWVCCWINVAHGSSPVSTRPAIHYGSSLKAAVCTRVEGWHVSRTPIWCLGPIAGRDNWVIDAFFIISVMLGWVCCWINVAHVAPPVSTRPAVHYGSSLKAAVCIRVEGWHVRRTPIWCLGPIAVIDAFSIISVMLGWVCCWIDIAHGSPPVSTWPAVHYGSSLKAAVCARVEGWHVLRTSIWCPNPIVGGR